LNPGPLEPQSGAPGSQTIEIKALTQYAPKTSPIPSPSCDPGEKQENDTRTGRCTEKVSPEDVAAGEMEDPLVSGIRTLLRGLSPGQRTVLAQALAQMGNKETE